LPDRADRLVLFTPIVRTFRLNDSVLAILLGRRDRQERQAGVPR
jgi:hypothetical protein